MTGLSNKGTGFSEKERSSLAIEGLLPPRVETLEEQSQRCKMQIDMFDENINRYIYLAQLQETNEALYYRVLLDNLTDLLPIVYTPTVGEACLRFDSIFRRTRGMYLSPAFSGRFVQVLRNWKHPVEVIVITDSSRILGLGDLGTNGMGIPIGKLSLYVAMGGFSPANTLPITFDVGCNNPAIVDSEFYLGRRHRRVEGEEYYSLWNEFMSAVEVVFPGALVQFEDIALPYCAELLERHRHRGPYFNDDLQGTGAVVLAGLINYLRATEVPISELRVVFFGAGSAATGVADAIVAYLVDQGISHDEARARFWFVDSKGLVSDARGDKLPEHKIPYSRKGDVEHLGSLKEVISLVKPHALFGLAAIGPAFNQEIIEILCEHVERPFVAALSNPTSKAEISAQQTYDYSKGKAYFASGTPFPPVEYEGKIYKTTVANNCHIFPAVGRAASLIGATEISDGMLLASAKSLALSVPDSELKEGRLYPDIEDARATTVKVAAGVMQAAIDEDLNSSVPPADLEKFIESKMWTPTYWRPKDHHRGARGTPMKWTYN